MSVFKKFFRGGSSNKSIPTDNPALSYVQDNYGIDIRIFIRTAQMIHIHSASAAYEFAELLNRDPTQFAELLNRDPTQDTTHFFFDYFLAYFFMVAGRGELPNNKDAASAIIEGMHLEFYDDVSQQAVDSVLALMASDDPCFFRSFLDILQRKDRYRMLITMVVRSFDRNYQLGAIQGIAFAKP